MPPAALTPTPPRAHGLRIVVNGRCLIPPRTGVGRYCAGLLGALATRPEVEHITAFCGSALDGKRRLADRFFRTPLVPRLTARLLAGPAVRHLARRLGGAIYFEPNYMLVKYSGPAIATIHDLSALRFPEFHPARRVRLHERHLRSTLARADHLLTVSELVRREVMDLFGVAPGRITAVPCGVERSFRPRPLGDATLCRTLARHGLVAGGYVLSVGTLEPRKNLDTLLTAWQGLPAALRREHPLVLAGTSGWKSARLESRLVTLENAGCVRRLGFVPETDLPALYAGARLFVYPSLYVGFGLPPLEAMAAGVPVVTSRGTAMEEVAAGAALLVEPRDPDELGRALANALGSPELLRDLATRGLARAAEFNWDRAADAIVALLEGLGA